MNPGVNDLVLESPLLQLPNELLKACIKSQQRVLEKEMSLSISLLHNARHQDQAGRQAQCKEVLDRLRTLRRKLKSLQRDEEIYIRHSHKRTKHMKDMLIDNHDTNKIQKTQPNIRLLRLIAEYMLRHNLLESASLVAKTFQMRDLLDLDVFAQSKRIRNALLNRDTAECLAWCNEHRSTLKRNKNQLEFELKQQDFIELVRQRRIDDAIIHAKKHLASYRLAYPAIFSRVCALLCHQSDTRLEPYKNLYAPSRWIFLADLFDRTFQDLFSIPSVAPFEVGLSAGLSALKTSCCGQRSNHEGSSQSACPVCSATLNGLAVNVPIAHAARSHLIDRLTRLPIDQDNEPMVLPDGRLFGSRLLTDGASKLVSQLDLPNYQDLSASDVRRAYIL